MFGDTAIVKVGEDLERSFTLHKGLLSFYSGYFNTALNGEFSEAKSGIIELPTEEIETFERFVLWLYTGHFERGIGWDYETITKLWLLGDRRGIPLLQNLALNEIREYHGSEWQVPTGVINLAYQESFAKSPLQRFLIYLISTYSAANIVLGPELKDYNEWGKEALWDLARAVWTAWESGKVQNARSKDELAKSDLCAYHVDEEGVQCLKGIKHSS